MKDFYGQLFFINAPLGFAFKYIVYIAYCRTISQSNAMRVLRNTILL